MINYERLKNELTIKNTFIPNIILENSDSEYIETLYDVGGVTNIMSFVCTYIGSSTVKDLTFHISVSKSTDRNWSEWFEIKQGNNINNDTLILSPNHKYNFKIKFKRTGSVNFSPITISDYRIKFNQIVNDVYELALYINKPNIPYYYRVPNTYKIFSISDINITTKGETSAKYLDIEYRISQDSGRTWTPFIKFTKDNIQQHKINPIRFVNIEYKITRLGSDESGTIGIADIDIIGDIQNVTADYKKSNLMGIKDCCISNINNNFDTPIPDNILNDIDDETKSNLFKPYNLPKENFLLSKLNSDATNILGHKVRYYTHSADGNGLDYVLNEIQLYNVDCVDYINILVPDNQFPDNQVVFSIHDMSLFESFEIHITKKDFKRVFGEHRMPTKEDIIEFCDLNRVFRVEHAQEKRDFNNTATYYRVVLNKYNDKANIKTDDSSIQEKINDILKNSTIENLFGTEITEDINKDVKKKTQSSLSNDFIRYKFNCKIVKENIDNADLVVSKNNYSLWTSSYSDAVIYANSDATLQKGVNRAILSWIKFKAYNKNDIYNLITNYDETKKTGYKINVSGNKLTFTINYNTYSFTLPTLYSGVWYNFLLNINQRTSKLELFIYTRNVDTNKQQNAKFLRTSELKTVLYTSIDYTPEEFELNDNSIKIKASNISMTNIRIYDDVVEQDKHNKVLNQYNVIDTDRVILSDNCNEKVHLIRYPLN